MNRLLCRDKIYAYCSAVAAAEATFPSLPVERPREGTGKASLNPSAVSTSPMREKNDLRSCKNLWQPDTIGTLVSSTVHLAAKAENSQLNLVGVEVE